MKKVILSVVAIATIFFASCSSDDDNGKSCEQLSNDVMIATEAYQEDQSQENCEAYKATLQAYVDAGCEGSASLEAIIESLDCTEE